MVISSSAVEEGEVDWSTDDDVDVVVAFTSGLAGGAKAMVEPTDMESSIRECKDFIVLCCYANLCIKLHSVLWLFERTSQLLACDLYFGFGGTIKQKAAGYFAQLFYDLEKMTVDNTAACYFVASFASFFGTL